MDEVLKAVEALLFAALLTFFSVVAGTLFVIAGSWVIYYGHDVFMWIGNLIEPLLAPHPLEKLL